MDDTSRKYVEAHRWAIQHRPVMYLGREFTIDALYHLIAWHVQAAASKTSSNHASRVDIVLASDNWVTISDNGVGLPIGLDGGNNPKPIIEVTFTRFFTGGITPEDHEYNGFPFYIGAVLNTLSTHMIVQTHRDSALYEIAFKDGALAKPLTMLGESDGRGTRIRFQPEMSLFKRKHLRMDRLAQILEATKIDKHAIISLSRK